MVDNSLQEGVEVELLPQEELVIAAIDALEKRIRFDGDVVIYVSS
jgi:hypothetical protein